MTIEEFAKMTYLCCVCMKSCPAMEADAHAKAHSEKEIAAYYQKMKEWEEFAKKTAEELLITQQENRDSIRDPVGQGDCEFCRGFPIKQGVFSFAIAERKWGVAVQDVKDSCGITMGYISKCPKCCTILDVCFGKKFY